MGQYRYVGASIAEIWDTPFKLTRFGQLVEMPDNIAKSAITGTGLPNSGMPLILASDWGKYAITDDELKAHGPDAGNPKVTDAFAAKRDRIWKELPDLKKNALDAIEHPTPAPAPAPAEPASAPVSEP